MARGQEDFSSLRFSRAEIARLVAAMLLSVLLHLAIWGGYHTGEKEGWWQKWHAPAWLHLTSKKHSLQAQIAHNEEPTIFVDVSHADSDTPQRTKFYSNKSSQAANPDVADANVPRIEGRQTDVPKTENVPRPVKASAASPEQPAKETPTESSAETKKTAPTDKPKIDNVPELAKLQPSMPPPSLLSQATEPPDAPPTPGETDLRPKHMPSPAPTTPTASGSTATLARPRTLRQALAQRDQLPGEKMQQEGGVARHANWATLDVKNTPFGDYDSAIVQAVSQRWYDLLDSRRFAQDRSGKVILRFKLKPDGSIIEMQTLENTVGELLGYLCQEAIEEAAPFAKWPSDMAREVGTNSRDITFTFYYY